MTDTVIEAVLRHDHAIVAGALVLLAGLAWAYMLWLAADMDMGGMDMSGFRMISAGMALMMPTTAPWNATESAFVFAMWAALQTPVAASALSSQHQDAHCCFQYRPPSLYENNRCRF